MRTWANPMRERAAPPPSLARRAGKILEIVMSTIRTAPARMSKLAIASLILGSLTLLTVLVVGVILPNI